MIETYKTYDEAAANMTCDGRLLSNPHMPNDPNADAYGRVWIIVLPRVA